MRIINVKPEKMTDKDLYPFTLNYGTDRKLVPELQLLRMYGDQLIALREYATVQAYPEISRYGILHIHGWFRPKKIMYIPFLYRLLNNLHWHKNISYKIDYISNPMISYGWYDYMTKQRYFMENYINVKYGCFGFEYNKM